MQEINENFYCSAFAYKEGDCSITKGSCGKLCSNYHRKWPTLEQFKKEYCYGWEGAVYYFIEDSTLDWICFDLRNALWAIKGHLSEKVVMVAACTPFGKPPVDWRPPE